MIKLEAVSPNRMPRLVSVIIGTYNGARHLRPTIDSVLAQTYSPLELIVVDDGSTDDTWSLLQSYGDRIVAVRQANGGVPAARNTGLQHARGEFIALMDHDDLCMPQRLAIQVALMDRHADVELCSTEFSAFNEQGPIADRYSGVYYSRCAPETGGAAAHFPHRTTLDLAPDVAVPVYMGKVYDRIACGNFIHPPTVLFRARLLDQVGGFEPAARMMCDWYWLVGAAKAGVFAYIDHPLLDYRRSATQISGNNPNAKIDTMEVAERIAADDPALWQRQKPALRTLLAEVTLDVAYTQARTRPWLALKLLARSTLLYRRFNNVALLTLIRALLPETVQSWVQQHRRIGASR